MLPTLLRVTPATAITFVVYENVSHRLIQISAASSSNSNLKIGDDDTLSGAPLTPAVL
jgi:solute carrier family 25 folate transporter 32